MQTNERDDLLQLTVYPTCTIRVDICSDLNVTLRTVRIALSNYVLSFKMPKMAEKVAHGTYACQQQEFLQLLYVLTYYHAIHLIAELKANILMFGDRKLASIQDALHCAETSDYIDLALYAHQCHSFEAAEHVLKALLRVIREPSYKASFTKDWRKLMHHEHLLPECGAKQKLIAMTYEKYMETYDNIRLIYSGTSLNEERFQIKGEFLEMPYNFMLHWVKSPRIKTDSENSVFYLLLLWALHKPRYTSESRSIYLAELFKYVNYYRMKYAYVFDILPVVHKIIKDLDDDAAYNLRIGRNAAMLIKIAPWTLVYQMHWADDTYNLPIERQMIPESEQISFKCVFDNISEWREDLKYHSSSILMHGYEFCFFIQRQEVPTPIAYDDQDREQRPKPPPTYGAAGFLRCNGMLSRPESEVSASHYLPVEYNIVVITPNHEPQERKFKPMRVVFQSTEKAIGGRLTIGQETWKSFVNGLTPLTFRNQVTVIISLRLLESDENCSQF